MLVAGISGCSDSFVIKRLAKQKNRVEKIELELIMSDIAIGKSRCSDLFCHYDNVHGYCPHGGYLSIHS